MAENREFEHCRLPEDMRGALAPMPEPALLTHVMAAGMGGRIGNGCRVRQ